MRMAFDKCAEFPRKPLHCVQLETRKKTERVKRDFVKHVSITTNRVRERLIRSEGLPFGSFYTLLISLGFTPDDSASDHVNCRRTFRF